jgi:hypothetical protein
MNVTAERWRSLPVDPRPVLNFDCLISPPALRDFAAPRGELFPGAPRKGG